MHCAASWSLKGHHRKHDIGAVAMKITRVQLSRKHFEAMPRAERTAVLLLGHACNEIGVLQKIILIASAHNAPPNKVIDQVQAAQVLILLRILVGKLHEAWRLFTKRGQPLRAKYLPQLSAEATAALNSLGRHFANDQRLAAIRNQQSFHYSDDHDLVEQHLPNIPETEPWNFYLSGPQYNSFYYASELVITNVTAQLAMPSDAKFMTGHLAQEQAGVNAYFELAYTVAGQITGMFGEFIAAIITSTMSDIEAEEIEIGPAAKFSQLELPFFWDEADFANMRQHLPD